MGVPLLSYFSDHHATDRLRIDLDDEYFGIVLSKGPRNSGFDFHG